MTLLGHFAGSLIRLALNLAKMPGIRWKCPKPTFASADYDFNRATLHSADAIKCHMEHVENAVTQ